MPSRPQSPSHSVTLSPGHPVSRLLRVALLPFALLLAAGCGRHGVAAPTGGSEVPPSQVKLARHVLIAPVELKDLTYTANTVGTLEPERQTSIAAGIAGVVDDVAFREGDVWTDEDLENPDKFLVKIDQVKYRAALDLAVANENRAQENLKRSDAKLSLVRDQSDRAARLSERQAISQEEVTRWAQELKVAAADRAAAEAEQSVAHASRELAERDLEKSKVRPPYKGQINQRRVARGDYVKDETVIATIADIDNLRLVTWIPEMVAPGVRNGDKIQFELQAVPDQTLVAKIFYISTVADPQTHMFECKAALDRESLASDLCEIVKPGLFARVKLTTEKHRNACVIPEESVRASERGFVAFVPELKTNAEGKATWVAAARRLELGFRKPGFVEVLAGVRPGDRVVTRGAEALEDGTPIEFPTDEQKAEVTAEAEREKNGKT